MPLLLAGNAYEWPRRKVTDALNEFTETVLKARSECKKKVIPLEDREIKNIPGSDPDTLIAVQREYACVAGDKNTKVREATLNMPHKIGSVDATTCLILSLTNPANGDVTVAHLDSDKQVDKGIENMLKLIGVPSIDCKSAPPGAVRAADAPTPVVKVAMLGCVVYYEYSPATLSAILKKFTSCKDVIFDFGFGFDIAVWNLNFVTETKQIKRRGLLVDVSKNTVEGQCVPIECMDDNRSYPDARLRSLRSFAKDPSLSCITLFKGEESALKITQKEKPAAAAAAAPAGSKAIEGNSRMEVLPDNAEEAEKQLKASKEAEEEKERAHQEKYRTIFKCVVRPFEWPAMLQDAAKKPEAWFYQLSSTPDMEPADFAKSVKQSVIFGNIFKHDQLFKMGRPRVFVPSAEDKKWAEI